MDDAMSAKLMADFPSEAICYLPRSWCRTCSESTRTNRRPSACDKHEVKPCAKCRTRITTAHVDLEYVGHADVRHRLCEADPEWTWEPHLAMPGGAFVTDGASTVGLWILLTVGGVTKPGYGSCEKGKNEAIKELIGDALRNAAQSFGVAWKLWAKGDRSAQEGEQAASHADETAGNGGRWMNRPLDAPPAALQAKRARTRTTGADHEALRDGAVEAAPGDRPARRVKAGQNGGDDPWDGQPPGELKAAMAYDTAPGTADSKILKTIHVQLTTLGIKDRDAQLTRLETMVNGPLGGGPHKGSDGSDRTSKNLSSAEAHSVWERLAAEVTQASAEVAAP